ncbi:hypothetical protein FRC12_017203 [Ceratobasidium sp. 428]|nr:hypothetical protein FRC12_017203 [Ceratobasidium sp. 428]
MFDSRTAATTSLSDNGNNSITAADPGPCSYAAGLTTAAAADAYPVSVFCAPPAVQPRRWFSIWLLGWIAHQHLCTAKQRSRRKLSCRAGQNQQQQQAFNFPVPGTPTNPNPQQQQNFPNFNPNSTPNQATHEMTATPGTDSQLDFTPQRGFSDPNPNTNPGGAPQRDFSGTPVSDRDFSGTPVRDFANNNAGAGTPGP